MENNIPGLNMINNSVSSQGGINVPNPEQFKQMVIKKYPNGVSDSGIPYSQMDATELTSKVVQKYPDGVTESGIKYADFLPKNYAVNQQKDILRSQGQPVSIKENRVEPTFLGGMVRDIIKPAATLATTIIKPFSAFTKTGQGLDEPFSGDYLGKVEALKGPIEDPSITSFKKALGTGLNIGSNITSGGTVGTVGKEFVEGGTKQLLKNLAIEGGITGAGYGLGSSLEQNKGLGETLLNTGLGGATGAITAPTVGLLAKGLNKLPSVVKTKTPEMIDTKIDTNIKDVYRGITGDSAKINEMANKTKRGIERILQSDLNVVSDTSPLGKKIKTPLDLSKASPNEIINGVFNMDKKLAGIDNYSMKQAANKGVKIDTTEAYNLVNQAEDSGFITKGAANQFRKQINAIGDDILKAHEFVKNINKQYGKTYERQGVFKPIGEVADGIAGIFRKDFDKYVDRKGYAEAYGDNQELKRLIVAIAKKANKTNIFSNIADLSSEAGLDAAISVLTGNPLYMARTVGSGLFRSIVKDIQNKSKLNTIRETSKLLFNKTNKTKLPIIGVKDTYKSSVSLPNNINTQGINIDNNMIKNVIPKVSNNIENKSRVISEEAYQKAFKNLSDRNNLNSTPIHLSKDALIVAGYHIENGVRSAAELAVKLAEAGYKFTKEQVEELYNKATKSLSTPYKETGNLTTKILKDLEGKTTVSKQYILDATNRGELKQAERDITRQILDTMPDGPINVQEFAKKVQAELLPLERTKNIKPQYENVSLPEDIRGSIKNYSEHIYQSPIRTSAGQNHFRSSVIRHSNLTSDEKTILEILRDNDAHYSRQLRKARMNGNKNSEKTYQNLYTENKNKIKELEDKKEVDTTPENYFGHTRIEDMADNKTRRVIEVQSDLYQKGNLERELKPKSVSDASYDLTYGKGKIKYNGRNYNIVGESNRDGKTTFDLKEIDSNAYLGKEERINNIPKEDILSQNPELDKIIKESVSKERLKLQQYNDPTAHYRMIREEIKKAAQDGKTKLQFPTGETAMKIEGIETENTNWSIIRKDGTRGGLLNINDIENPDFIGREIVDRGDNSWIITDVLGDGKFTAVSKAFYERAKTGSEVFVERADQLEALEKNLNQHKETFDISGKVDTNNPIYKFYEKDVTKYLNKFGGKKIVDDKGVSWIEIPITKEMGKMPVEAFGLVGLLGLGAASSASASNKEIPNLEKETTNLNPESVYNIKYKINEKLNDGSGYRLDNGQVVLNIKPLYQKKINEMYKKYPNIPKGLLEATIVQESSAGTDPKTKNSTSKFVGLTGIAKKELGYSEKYKPRDNIKAIDDMARYYDKRINFTFDNDKLDSNNNKLYNKGDTIKIVNPVKLYKQRYNGNYTEDLNFDKFASMVDYYKKIGKYEH